MWMHKLRSCSSCSFVGRGKYRRSDFFNDSSPCLITRSIWLICIDPPELCRCQCKAFAKALAAFRPLTTAAFIDGHLPNRSPARYKRGVICSYFLCCPPHGIPNSHFLKKQRGLSMIRPIFRRLKRQNVSICFFPHFSFRSAFGIKTRMTRKLAELFGTSCI